MISLDQNFVLLNEAYYMQHTLLQDNFCVAQNQILNEFFS